MFSRPLTIQHALTSTAHRKCSSAVFRVKMHFTEHTRRAAQHRGVVGPDPRWSTGVILIKASCNPELRGNCQRGKIGNFPSPHWGLSMWAAIDCWNTAPAWQLLRRGEIPGSLQRQQYLQPLLRCWHGFVYFTLILPCLISLLLFLE